MSKNNIKLQIDTIEIPDELHSRSLMGIQKAREEMQAKRRRWYKQGAIVASLAIMVGIYQLYTAVELPPALTRDSDSQIIASHKNDLIKGPAPTLIEMSIKPDKSEYNLNDTVKMKVQIKNVWNKAIDIVNNPSILVGAATISTDRYTSIPLPDLGGKHLQPGESVSTDVSWKQIGKPGLYGVQFGEIDLGISRISGGGGNFFVKYPPNAVQNKTIESGTKINLPTETGELTLVIKKIEMNELETKVYFDFLTDLEAPMNFQLLLARTDGESPEPAHGLEQSGQKNGVIKAQASFNPTTNDVQKLQFIITDWAVIYKGDRTEILKGPWTLEVPINK